MKRKYLFGCIVTFLLLICNQTFAVTFTIDGLQFTTLLGEDHEVTVSGISSSSSAIDIPETITYSNQTYYVKEISTKAFQGCSSIHSILIPASIRFIGEDAFAGCDNLVKIIIPNIGSWCRIDFDNVDDSDSNPIYIAHHIYKDENTEYDHLVIPENVKTIPESAFQGCYSFSSVEISEGVNEIGFAAFADCVNLVSVTIPNSVSSIRQNAFNSCSSLSLVHSYMQKPPTVSSNAFDKISEESKLIIPYGTMDSYLARGWNNIFKTIVEESPDSYTLNIVASGNGCIQYDNVEIRNGNKSFDIDNGASIILIITPDEGNRVKNIKVNDTDVTSSITNNQYTINSISANTNVVAEFEENPTTYTLSIQATGNGTVSYDNTAVKNKTTTFTVNEGTSATITLTPDDGYRVKSLTMNSTDVKASISNNQYTISNITSNTTVVAEFEAIPPTTYTLSIQATGNGTVSYGNTSVRGKTSTFTVNKGTSATISLTPDEGYQVKSLTVNDTDVKASISNNQYTISSINANTNVVAEFEAISGNEPYAVLSEDKTVLTFYYDNQKGTRGGLNVGPFNHQDERTWKGISVTKIVFDDSFATCTSLTSTAYWFIGYKDLTTIINIDNLNTNNVTDMCYMFYDCQKLSSLDLSKFNTNNVTNMSYMFNGCSNLSTIYVDSEWNTVKVNHSSGMFSGCNNLVGGMGTTYDTVHTDHTYAHIDEGASNPGYLTKSGTYRLTIKATGNGTVSHDNKTVKNETTTFTVNVGSSATIMLTPDEGYRVKSLTVNNTDVKASISNNQYTISSINANTTVVAEFEAIPPTTYTLSIKATGNGTVSFDDTTINNTTKTFSIAEGSVATISFTPEEGYRVKSLTVNDKDKKAEITNNQYTLGSINADTNVEVVFEVIPEITYTLSIKATGNGSATYGETSIRNNTGSFTLKEGASATISLAPDDGYRIKTLTVDGVSATSGIVNKAYTIGNISANTSIEVVFEVIPETKYTLTIKATGNGKATYESTDISNTSKAFSIAEGSYANIVFTADVGYRIKTVKANNVDVTLEVENDQYSIDNISGDMTIEVEFEAIPEKNYTLTIKASGNGVATYGEKEIRNTSEEFTLAEGANAVISFTADEDNKLKAVKVNNNDVTSSISNDQYTIHGISADTYVEVEFAEDLSAFESEGVKYTVVSLENQTVNVTSSNYELVLDVPATVSAKEKEWKVVGIEKNSLKDATDLAAIIWQPEYAFTEKVSNPNLLLYVKSTDYAPANVKNVIVNNKAKNITLTDAANGNNFYCPQEFTSEQITYEHNYSMKTGYSTCQGWETIVLPFDVAVVTNNIGTELVPYSQWTLGDSKRPFWLFSMNEDGWKAADAIAANTPYIISMPNNDNYDATYNISGNIVFSASNVTVHTSDNLISSKHGHRNLMPNYQNRESSSDIYALNVNNLWDQNTDSDLTEGSAFIRDSRQTRPFEAYMTIDSSGGTTRSIGIFDDDDATGIMSLPLAGSQNDGVIRVYSLSGVLLKQGSDERILDELPKGIYVVNGKKVCK